MYLFVDNVTPIPLPTCLTVALALDAGAVIRAGRIFAVDLFASVALPTFFTTAGTADALTMSGTISHAAVGFRDIALRSFPTFFAMTETATVLTVSRAKDRANTFIEENVDYSACFNINARIFPK